ncbi:recombinase family protein [Streptosporangium sp. OZ121]|uniref:recombinase family protein n=1 Tax=Streptosporangium sp. OZ121 TaxID=3444183 RepID=UPI003F7A5CFD
MWTLTEQHDVDSPIVYGYLRLHRSTPERHAALTVALAQYCEQHELQLCGVFTDRGAASSDDPAFAGLLDVLLMSGAYGVVLPTTHHLGEKPVATRRREQLNAIGARLLVVRGALRATGSSAGRPVVTLARAVPHDQFEPIRQGPHDD